MAVSGTKWWLLNDDGLKKLGFSCMKASIPCRVGRRLADGLINRSRGISILPKLSTAGFG